jgi:hypothetical protein
MKLVFGLLFIGLLSGSALAQSDPSQLGKEPFSVNQLEQLKSEAGRMLFSPSLKERAWGAHLVGKLGLKEQANALLVAAKNSLEDSGDQEKVVYLLALDSLIQLGVALPAEDLLPLYKYSPDAVMILLSRAPQENREALLAIARQVKSNEQNKDFWLAACNLLAESKAKGLAAYLLSEMTINAEVTVSDEGGGGGVAGWGSSIGCGGAYTLNIAEDFPPIGFYLLHDSAKGGRVVLAAGTHTSYFERTVRDPKQGPVAPPLRSFYGWNKNDYIVEQRATMLNIRVDGFEFKNSLWRYYIWVNLADYQMQMAAYKAKILQSYDALKSQLIAAELLTPAESESLKAKIVFKVYDYRTDKNKKIKLPEIAGEVKSPKGN